MGGGIGAREGFLVLEAEIGGDCERPTTCVNNNNYSVWHTFFVKSDDEGVIKGAYKVIRGNLSKLEVKSELHILILLGELRGCRYIYKEYDLKVTHIN